MPPNVTSDRPRLQKPRPPSDRVGRPRPRRLSFGRIALICGLGLLATAAAGLGLLLVAPPTDLVRAHVSAEVERQTGRTLVVGSAGLSVVPGLGVSLTGVSLSAPPAMVARPLLTAERVEVRVALLPLVFREVRIERLVLVRPELNLSIDAAGRRSWDFAASDARPAARVRYAQMSADGRASDAAAVPAVVGGADRDGAAAATDRRIGMLDQLTLSELTIVDGRVRFEDATGQRRDVSRIEARLTSRRAGGPVTVQGQFVASDQSVTVDAWIDELGELAALRPVSARIAASAAIVDARFEGELTVGPAMAADGRLSFRTTTPAALANVLELPFTGLEHLGAVSVAGELAATPASLALGNGRFEAGGSSGTGTISLDGSGVRPSLAVDVRLATMDLDQLAAIGRSSDVVAQNSVGRFAAPAAAMSHRLAFGAGLSGERGHETPARSPAFGGDRSGGQEALPASRRDALGNRWNVEAIDLTELRNLDADVKLAVDRLSGTGIDAGTLELVGELKGGVLRVNLTDGALGGGRVKGLAFIDGRHAEASLGANLSGDDVALGPLLALAGLDAVDGRGRINVAVTAQGRSEREIVSTLTGRADFKASDGALLGWDAEAIIDELARGRLPPVRRQSVARTPFRQLSASFEIVDGVARSRDITLDSRALSVSGSGTVNIVDRNVDLVLKTAIAGSNLEVPLRVAGMWDDPRIVPDVARTLESPQARDAIGKLKEGDVESALRSVLGTGPKADERIGKAKELLRGLIGR